MKVEVEISEEQIIAALLNKYKAKPEKAPKKKPYQRRRSTPKRRWTTQEKVLLRNMLDNGYRPSQIGKHLKRSTAGINMAIMRYVPPKLPKEG